MRLYVIRHALAEERSEQWPDDDERPLSAEGAERMSDAARGLREVIGGIDRMWSSPLVRARQTADVLVKFLDSPDGYDTTPALRPEALPSEILSVLAGAGGDSVGVVGHEPHCSRLITFLLTGNADPAGVEMKKGATAALDFDGRPEPGGGVLVFLLPPRVLRSL